MTTSHMIDRSQGGRVARLIRRALTHKGLIFGALIVTLVVSVAVLAPRLAPRDPNAQDLARRLEPPSFLSGGEYGFILGSDQLGRDVLSRIMFGARISLTVAAASILASGFLGTTLGLIAGYYEGNLGSIIMRIADIQIALPPILLAVTVATVFGTSLKNVVVVLAISTWITYARIVFNQVRSLKQKQYVLAASSLGASDARIMQRHIFPNLVGPLTVVATLSVGRMILFEAALSFLGLGVPPPAPSWGNMLNDGRNALAVASWLSVFPGLAIVVTVLGINFLGNGLQELLDPMLRRR